MTEAWPRLATCANPYLQNAYVRSLLGRFPEILLFALIAIVLTGLAFMGL
jgi:hypothetical protein